VNVPRTDSNNENFRQVIGSGEFTNGVSHELRFVIDGGILNRQTLPYQIPGYGTHNHGYLIVDVWFRVTGAHGSLKFNNVILWFKRGVVADVASDSNINQGDSDTN
jgi:hypothetical protein